MENENIVRVSYERLDFSTVVELEKELFGIMRTSPEAVLLDMAKVEYVDSRAVGLFVAFKMQCDKKNIRLVLFNLNQEVRYIFHVTSVDSVIDIFNSEEEAIKGKQ